MTTYRSVYYLARCSLFLVACGGEISASAPDDQNLRLATSDTDPITCSLSVSPSVVSYPGSTFFQVAASAPLPAGSAAFWNGTKDGTIDAVDEPSARSWATGTFPIDYLDPKLAGHYVRYAVIKDAAGKTLCTTGAVSVVFLRPSMTCALSASLTDVPPLATTVLTITATGATAGDVAYWYGTKDGVADASGAPTLPPVAAGSFPIVNSPGFKGDYVRWAVVRDKMGTPLCTTNKVSVIFR